MSKSLTNAGVARLKAKAARYTVPDPELRGHYVRVAPTGAKMFVTVARDPSGKQIWTTIGSADVLGIEAARWQAREIINRVRAGEFAKEVPKETFQAVAENYIKRHVEAKGLRTHYEINRLLKVYVLPVWGSREFTAIRRSDVAALLDEVQDNNGARQADCVLAIISGIANWYAARNDDYVAPIARGMRRNDAKARQRERILNDDELRAVWQAADESGTFGGLVKMLLLTAQRREKVASMQWSDVSIDGEWHIPAEKREKTTGGTLALPASALDIIHSQPHFASNPYVFAGRGGRHFSDFAAHKVVFAAKAKVAPWVLHDLRRTAKSLMARSGVRPDISERVLGHVIGGVEGIYDRHRYEAEKADALKRLAALVESIVNPPEGNVIELRGRA